MPALLRYFSDLIHFKTSNPNPIPLHGNPVLDNFVFKHAAVQTGRTFASAHSCGLRPRTMMIFCNLQIFASAHSCGLRPRTMMIFCNLQIFASAHSCGLRPIPVQQTRQRVSLPQRIRAGCDEGSYGNGKSLSSLPQRIRAGCDRQQTRTNQLQKRFASAHSRGLRPCCRLQKVHTQLFATAHSCGLRPSFSSFAPSSASFATAHSCGLRRNHDYSD